MKKDYVINYKIVAHIFGEDKTTIIFKNNREARISFDSVCKTKMTE